MKSNWIWWLLILAGSSVPAYAQPGRGEDRVPSAPEITHRAWGYDHTGMIYYLSKVSDPKLVVATNEIDSDSAVAVPGVVRRRYTGYEFELLSFDPLERQTTVIDSFELRNVRSSGQGTIHKSSKGFFFQIYDGRWRVFALPTGDSLRELGSYTDLGLSLVDLGKWIIDQNEDFVRVRFLGRSGSSKVERWTLGMDTPTKTDTCTLTNTPNTLPSAIHRPDAIVLLRDGALLMIRVHYGKLHREDTTDIGHGRLVSWVVDPESCQIIKYDIRDLESLGAEFEGAPAVHFISEDFRFASGNIGVLAALNDTSIAPRYWDSSRLTFICFDSVGHPIKHEQHDNSVPFVNDPNRYFVLTDRRNAIETEFWLYQVDEFSISKTIVELPPWRDH